MNLTHDPWIPVVGADGRQRTVSLQELFATAHEIRDVSVKPHERIALMRLLICITQAALQGPKDYDEWEQCGPTIQPCVAEYLRNWMGSFELFDDDAGFLQMPGLSLAKEDQGEGTPATKLDLTLASGNNASLFDNAAGDVRRVEPSRLALMLLTFQCFSPGGRIGVAKWNGGVTFGGGSSTHAPCVPSGMIHTFPQGTSLLTTIHLNLLNKEDASDLGPAGWGKPVWEMPVRASSDTGAIANATRSYLGRLVPLSRFIRLDADCRKVILANGLDYPLAPIFREPSATMVQRDEQVAVLGVDLARSLWRQLPAITVKRRSSKDAVSGPIALRNVDGTQGCVLWIGALASDKAKIEDVVDSTFEVPPGMFRDAGRKLFEEGVALASLWQDTVSKSVKTYSEQMKMQPVPYDRARRHYWTLVEQYVPLLLQLSDQPDKAGDLTKSEWGNQLMKAAHASFDACCPHQTPRQIQAFAMGLQQLYLPKPKDPNASIKRKVPTKKRQQP